MQTRTADLYRVGRRVFAAGHRGILVECAAPDGVTAVTAADSLSYTEHQLADTDGGDEAVPAEVASSAPDRTRSRGNRFPEAAEADLLHPKQAEGPIWGHRC